MNDDMKWMRVKGMEGNVMNDFLLSLSVSFFGLILIFGLGFVFPNVNPYTAIKWIVIVCAVFFVYSLITFIIMKVMTIRVRMAMRKEFKEVKTAAKAKRTSRK